MKIHDRAAKTVYYFYLFDIIPYPRSETQGWTWNTQSWSCNSNDIILIPAGRGYPQMTGSTVPWIYNLTTKKSYCLHKNPKVTGEFWYIQDFYEGKIASQTTQTVTIDNFSADKETITKGESVKLSWQTTGATKASINNNIGTVDPDGAKTVTPSGSVTYVLTAEGNGEKKTAQVAITVNTEPVAQPLTLVAPAGGETFSIGQTVEIKWDYTVTLAGINIYVSLNGGIDWALVNDSVLAAEDKIFRWKIPSTIDGKSAKTSDALIRIEDYQDFDKYKDVLDKAFSITDNRQSAKLLQRAHMLKGIKIIRDKAGRIRISASSNIKRIEIYDPSGSLMQTISAGNSSQAEISFRLGLGESGMGIIKIITSKRSHIIPSSLIH
jgi:hypothetical protein